ncbi:ribosomal rna large subunit methyltransferase i, partial [Cystoisospora suis]
FPPSSSPPSSSPSFSPHYRALTSSSSPSLNTREDSSYDIEEREDRRKSEEEQEREKESGKEESLKKHDKVTFSPGSRLLLSQAENSLLLLHDEREEEKKKSVKDLSGAADRDLSIEEERHLNLVSFEDYQRASPAELSCSGVLRLRIPTGSENFTRRIRRQFPWVFTNEILDVSLYSKDGKVEEEEKEEKVNSKEGEKKISSSSPSSSSSRRPPPCLVVIEDELRERYGFGYFNPDALIAARLISVDTPPEKCLKNDTFFFKKLQASLKRRLAYSRAFKWMGDPKEERERTRGERRFLLQQKETPLSSDCLSSSFSSSSSPFSSGKIDTSCNRSTDEKAYENLLNGNRSLSDSSRYNEREEEEEKSKKKKRKKEKEKEEIERCESEVYCRLVNSEGDEIPGLLVDVYGKFICLQSITRGMDLLLPLVVSALRRLLHPDAIVIRRDHPDRIYEFPDSLSSSHLLSSSDTGDLSTSKISPCFSPPHVITDLPFFPSSVTIKENGCLFPVDLLNSPETGWHLNRRELRKKVASLSHKKKVLDLFAHSASFGITCLHAGQASTCTAVEKNPRSVQLARQAADMNSIACTSDRFNVIEDDVFEWLKKQKSLDKMDRSTKEEKDEIRRESSRDFDIVILDPPSRILHRRDVDAARQDLQNLIELSCARLPKRRKGREGEGDGFLVVLNNEPSRFYSDQVFRTDVSFACSRAGYIGVLHEEGDEGGLDFPRDLRFLRRRGSEASHFRWLTINLIPADAPPSSKV